MNKLTRRTVLGAGLGAGLLAANAARADAWRPTRPVRIVVPAAPGGTTDIVARLLSNHLTHAWGQACVVDNRSGAGGLIGTVEAVRAAPDGYTILSGNIGPQSIAYSLFRNMQYTPDDLIPVSNVVRGPNALMVTNDFPAQDFQQFLTYLRQNPGKVSCGFSGMGQSGHLAGIWFNQLLGTDFIQVPYRGAGPAMIELMAGNVQCLFDNLTTAVQQIRAGKVRLLAVTSATRSPLFPDIPTMSELVPELAQAKFDVSTWFGIFMPKGTPDPIIQSLNAEIKIMMDQPSVKQQISEQMAGIPSYSTPAEFRAFVNSEIAKWRGVVERGGLQLDAG